MLLCSPLYLRATLLNVRKVSSFKYLVMFNMIFKVHSISIHFSVGKNSNHVGSYETIENCQAFRFIFLSFTYVNILPAATDTYRLSLWLYWNICYAWEHRKSFLIHLFSALIKILAIHNTLMFRKPSISFKYLLINRSNVITWKF